MMLRDRAPRTKPPGKPVGIDRRRGVRIMTVTPRHTDNPTWTTRGLMAWTAKHLAQKNVDSPRLATEMLLAHVLGVERIKLYMDLDRPANDLERATFRALVERAAAHEPVDYLVGRSPFFSMMLNVNPAVLIPRPSTEALLEHVIQHARRTPGFHSPLIADVGTGSGAIAIALAKHIPHSRVIATDISGPALDTAKLNATEQGVSDRIEFRLGNLLEPIAHERLHYLVSNPPYISDAEWRDVERNVKDYEPESALRGGVDGLLYLHDLIEKGRPLLQKPGQLVLEAAASHKQALIKLANDAGTWDNPHVLADHEHLPRVLVCDAK